MTTQAYILQALTALTAIPSPTGMTAGATRYLLDELTALSFTPTRTRKGTVLCSLGGTGRPLLLSAHVDTLGAMVRAIKPNGRLRYTQIGGYNDNAIENENVTIYARSGKRYTGTVQSVHASGHVYGDKTAEARSDESLEIVVDEETWSKQATEALGVAPGDYIAFDTRTIVTDSGFIKSRHLDDKASSAVLLGLAREVGQKTIQPARSVTLAFTVYEEVGHGAAPVSAMAFDDMLSVDMGCVGDDLTCNETMVSICTKDSSGPYDREMTHELLALADKLSLPYAADIYPRYASDASAALRAGLEARCALCGPGVFASHGYERTHIKGLMATSALVSAYVQA